MKQKMTQTVMLLLMASLFPLLSEAQTGDVKLSGLFVNADPEGDTYFSYQPTMASAQNFTANLPTLFSQTSNTGAVQQVNMDNRIFNGASITTATYVHAQPYEGEGGNTYTFYGRFLDGGSPTTAFFRGNDYQDWVAGFGLAFPLDDHGGWNLGINTNFIDSKVLPSLNKVEGSYDYASGEFFSAGLSIAYNNKEDYRTSYMTFGASLSNLGFQLMNSGDYPKTFLPTDFMTGISTVAAFANGDMISWSLNCHISLAPALPYTDPQNQSYDKIGYGVFDPSGIWTLSTQIEYKICLSREGQAWLAVRGGAKLDDYFNERYTSISYGLGLKVKNFELNGMYFSIPSVHNTVLAFSGNTYALGIGYWIE